MKVWLCITCFGCDSLHCQKMAAGSRTSLEEERNVLARNRQFIVDNLEADDVIYIDELIQSRVLGANVAQRVQLAGVSRVEKNRNIVEQLNACVDLAGTLEVFCRILRRFGRQSFIADQLEKSRFILNQGCTK